MREDLLKACVSLFFERYPGGFENEELIKIGKKHKIEKMHDMVVDFFEEDKCDFVDLTIENMIKTVNRSSLVSLFEKPKFRDFCGQLDRVEKELLTQGLKEVLHGDFGKGFHMMADILSRQNLAKWTLMTVIPYYYKPTEHVFIKPTTTKNIIRIFELEGLKYTSKANLDFYLDYRQAFLSLKEKTDGLITDDNGAFSGFLMMTMEDVEGKNNYKK